MNFPVLTTVVIKSYPFWSLALLVPLCLYLTWGRKGGGAERGRGFGVWAAATLLVLLVAWLPVVLWGLYGPIFQLPSNVAA